MKIVRLMAIPIQKIGVQTKVLDSNNLSIIESLNEALITIDLQGTVLYWNNAAESLFGHTKTDVLSKKLPFITPHSEFELEHVIEKTKEEKSITFRTQKQTKNGNVLDLVMSTSPLFLEKQVIGVILIAKDYQTIKNVCFIPLGEDPIIREQKRTFVVLRNLILLTVGESKKTINQIANDSGINWKTVEKHLTHLIGKKLVQEVFSSEYVRIFELTSQGKSCIQETSEMQKRKYVLEE